MYCPSAVVQLVPGNYYLAAFTFLVIAVIVNSPLPPLCYCDELPAWFPGWSSTDRGEDAAKNPLFSLSGGCLSTSRQY